MKILIFEGRGEVIIGDPEQVEKLVDTWFNDTGRSLEDYDTYTVDGTQGFSFRSDIIADGGGLDNFEVREMISKALRTKLNEVDALDDVAEDLAAYEGPEPRAHPLIDASSQPRG